MLKKQLLWKTGSFGSVKPFWHSGEDDSYKNHLFVYKLEDETFQPVWCSSDLDRPIISFEIDDIDNDGLNELVVKEGAYREISKGRYALDTRVPFQVSVWKWEEWGFRFQETLSL